LVTAYPMRRKLSWVIGLGTAGARVDALFEIHLTVFFGRFYSGPLNCPQSACHFARLCAKSGLC
jgi:hypothetical protein